MKKSSVAQIASARFWRKSYTQGANGLSLDTGAGAIPPEFSHLFIYSAIRSSQTGGDNAVQIRFNGDTSANYYGNGVVMSGSSGIVVAAESVAATRARFSRSTGGDSTAGSYGTAFSCVPCYSDTSRRKQLVTVGALMLGKISADFWCHLQEGSWDSTAAINQITLSIGDNSNILAGSTMTLFAIA